MLKYFCAKNFYYHKSYLYIGDLTLTLESKYLCCWFFSQRYCTIPTNNSTTFQITSLHLKNYPSTIRDDEKQVLQIKSIFLIHWQSIKHLNSQSKKNCQKKKKLSFLVNCQIIVLYIFSMEREGVEENRNIFFPFCRTDCTCGKVCGRVSKELSCEQVAEKVILLCRDLYKGRNSVERGGMSRGTYNPFLISLYAKSEHGSLYA